MEIGLRLLAFIIDATICFFSFIPIVAGTGWVFNYAGGFGLILLPLWFVLIIAWPFIYFGVPTGLWGRTLGRWICRLRVTTGNDEIPGLWRGLGRESLKLLALGSSIGGILALLQLIYQGTTWYDQLCKTAVIFKPYVRLTKTQKHFRKVYGNQRRL